MSPRELSTGLRLSVGVRSCMYEVGVDQSHKVSTTLRSMPEGRDGLAKGSSPLAMRSVQSPKLESARAEAKSPRLCTMRIPGWPDWIRPSQASAEVLNLPSC